MVALREVAEAKNLDIGKVQLTKLFFKLIRIMKQNYYQLLSILAFFCTHR